MLAKFTNRSSPAEERTHFTELTRHFFKRLFNIELISEGAEAHVGVVRVLALLACPGLYYALLKYQTYSANFLIGLLPSNNAFLADHCLYVFFSMAVIGVVAVLEWDKLFPDRRDFANLMPLPLKLRTIFLSKIAALLEFVGLFILAVAGAPVLIYPLVASAGMSPSPSFRQLAWMMAAHGIAVSSGCLSMFLFFVALQGVLINLLTYAQFKTVTTLVQGLALVFFSCLFLLLPLFPRLLPVWEKAHSPWLYALPPMWFLGLYQSLLGAHGAAFLSLARISVVAFALAAVISAAGYYLAYRRHSQMAFESPDRGNTWRLGIAGLLGRLLDRLWLNEGPERASFYFVLKTLARSAKHRFYFVAYVSVALAIVLEGIVEVMIHSVQGKLWSSIPHLAGGLLLIPLVVSFFTLVGIRSAFEIPAELPANWIFRITEEDNAKKLLDGARKAVIALAVVPVFAASFVVYAELWGLMVSALTILFGALLCLILTELLLYSYGKIPFTCSHVPGKAGLSLTGAIACVLFAICAYGIALAEQWMSRRPVAWAVALAAELAVLILIIVQRNRSAYSGPGIEYEDKPIPAIQTLDLNA